MLWNAIHHGWKDSRIIYLRCFTFTQNGQECADSHIIMSWRNSSLFSLPPMALQRGAMIHHSLLFEREHEPIRRQRQLPNSSKRIACISKDVVKIQTFIFFGFFCCLQDFFDLFRPKIFSQFVVQSCQLKSKVIATLCFWTSFFDFLNAGISSRSATSSKVKPYGASIFSALIFRHVFECMVVIVSRILPSHRRKE